jgi:RNA polymerase sigma factor (sigma-70 family)
MENNMENTVKLAVNGDKLALEQVVKHIQDYIYNLAIRMLWHPEDAKDATQEVSIKIITNLGTFQFNSSFTTWVYRVATNNLINYKQKFSKHKATFGEFETQLAEGISDTLEYTSNEIERKLLVSEAKISCSNAMLQCLSADSRMVYILGEILEFNSVEASEILNISADNFRQKLSRARKSLHNFIHNNCGLVNPDNKCRCYKKVDDAIAKGRLMPNNLLFVSKDKQEELVEAIDKLESEVALFQTNPEYDSPADLLDGVKEIISTSGI